MPLYEIHSLDVWGNPVDGYEINDRRRAGEVYIPPSGEIGMPDAAARRMYEDRVVHALIETGDLKPAAMDALRNEELQVNADGDEIEITETETVFMADGGTDGEHRFIAAPNLRAAGLQVEPGEEVTTEVGDRPLLQLWPQILHGGGPVADRTEFFQIKLPRPERSEARQLALEFSRQLRRELTPENFAEAVRRNEEETNGQICHSHDFCDANLVMAAAFQTVTGREYRPMDTDIYDGLWSEAWGIAKESGFNPPYDVEVILGFNGGMLGILVRAIGAGEWVEPGVDHRTRDLEDRFEWHLGDWQRRPTLGFNPADSEEIHPTKKQLEEILVALDKYLESH